MFILHIQIFFEPLGVICISCCLVIIVRCIANVYYLLLYIYTFDDTKYICISVRFTKFQRKHSLLYFYYRFPCFWVFFKFFICPDYLRFVVYVFVVANACCSDK